MDGYDVPILGNTGICLTVAENSGVGIPDPYLATASLYSLTARRLLAFDSIALPAETWYPYKGITPPFAGVADGGIPYGFVGMDACWPMRILAAADPSSYARPDDGVFYVSNGRSPGDPQGLRGLPAMVCNREWFRQWRSLADFAGPGGWNVPDGLVTSGVPGSSDYFLTDPPYWFWAADEAEPDDWWWDRDGDGLFNAAKDYLDGDDDTPGAEGADASDFAYWNTARGEYHPEGKEYISIRDVASWGEFGCPISDYGLEDGLGLRDIWTPIYAISRLSPGDKIYFAPDNPQAFCARTPEGADVPMVPAAWAGRSRISAEWVDRGGRPALRINVRLGAEMAYAARLLFWTMVVKVDAVDLAITIQPRICGSLRGSDFCTHKVQTEESAGACDRTLGEPDTGRLCAATAHHPGYFPDAKTGERRGGGATDNELDHDGERDNAPEPVILADQNMLLELDVSAQIRRRYDPAGCVGLLGTAVCAGIDAYAESEIATAQKRVAAGMFNSLARAVYYGMENDLGHCVECGVESGFAAAAHYLRRWFWQPAFDRVPEDEEGFDHTRAPDPASLRFTDARWASSARDTAEFAFVWDQDLDGIGEEADNCPLVPNPEQQDWDYDCVGNACENDIDGDRCCEGCATDGGVGECVCGNNSSSDDPECERVELPGGGSSTCFDEETTSLWFGTGAPPDRDGDTVPNDCDRDDDGDHYPDREDSCPLLFDDENLDWSAPNPADPSGNLCDDDDDDDGCQDRAECRFRDFEPDDPMQPCGRYACVNGQCRTATAEGEVDGGSFPCAFRWDFDEMTWVPRCQGAFLVGGEWIDGTCMWDPTRTDPYYCDLPSDIEPPLCEFLHPPPPIEDVPESGGPGIPADLYTVHDFEEGFWTIADIIPCPGGTDCCWSARCGEPEVFLLDRFGNVLDTLHVTQATGLDASAFSEMEVAVVRDINGNRVHDVAISAPYAVGENNTLRGKVFTFDGASFELLRIREQPGAFGEALGRVEGGLATRVRPLYSFDELAADLSASAAGPIRTGVVITDRWGIESAFVPDPNDAYGTFVERIISGWIRDRELAVVYSPTCGGLTNVGCLAGYDQYGTVAWELRGWQSGNELGASFDSDGDYAVVGVPGYNQGTGGMVRVIDLRRNRAWNITQRNRAADFGRHVAIVASAAGPRIVASMLRDGVPRVLQMTLNGQTLREHGVPEIWEVVGIVSPTFSDGATDDRYAIVYRTDDGWVMHQWFRSSAERAR